MNLRRCAALRSNAITHYFWEGDTVTVCGRHITDDYTIRPDDEPVLCQGCVRALPRPHKQEQEAS